MYIGLHVSYQLLFSGFYKPGIFSAYFRKIIKHETLRKCVHWEPSYSVRTDRHDEVNSRFSQFYKTRLQMRQTAHAACVREEENINEHCEHHVTQRRRR